MALEDYTLAQYVNAYDLLGGLIEHYGSTIEQSAGQEGWIGLQLAQHMIEQSVMYAYGINASEWLRGGVRV